MANLLDQLYQARIQAEVGDTAAGDVAANVGGIIWLSYADKGALDKELQYLYAKRTAIDYRTPELLTRIQVTVGPTQHSYQQQYDHLMTMRAATQTEIERMEHRLVAAGGIAIGALTHAEPQSPPAVGLPDAMDPTFTGSPYKPIRRVTT